VPPTLATEKFTEDDYINWGKGIRADLDKSLTLIKKLKDKGSKIAGFGAAAKGCIYLNASGIDHNYIDYVIDDTNLKQGKFIPGTGIKIVSREVLKSNPVEYIIILAHNFSEYIIKSLRQDGYSGKFIVFLPKPKVI
jgi:methylation protein EvaC